MIETAERFKSPKINTIGRCTDRLCNPSVLHLENLELLLEQLAVLLVALLQLLVLAGQPGGLLLISGPPRPSLLPHPAARQASDGARRRGADIHSARPSGA